MRRLHDNGVTCSADKWACSCPDGVLGDSLETKMARWLVGRCTTTRLEASEASTRGALLFLGEVVAGSLRAALDGVGGGKGDSEREPGALNAVTGSLPQTLVGDERGTPYPGPAAVAAAKDVFRGKRCGDIAADDADAEIAGLGGADRESARRASSPRRQ